MSTRAGRPSGAKCSMRFSPGAKSILLRAVKAGSSPPAVADVATKGRTASSLRAPRIISFRILHALVALRLELAARLPARPRIRICERIAHRVERPKVFHRTAHVPIGLPFVRGLMIVVREVIVTQRHSRRRAAIDQIDAAAGADRGDAETREAEM